jgi:hypothetical protein
VISNNGFLISLQIVYAGFLKIEIFNSVELVCKANVFLSYITSFLSIWCVVFYNIERFMTVFYPFREFEVFGKSIIKLTITLLFVFAVCAYSFALFTSELESAEDGQFKCTTAARWTGLVKAFSLVDIFLSIIIPFLFIFLFNGLFSYKLMKTVWANRSDGGGGRTDVIFKTNDKALFITKQIIEHEKAGNYLPSLRNTRVCAVQPFPGMNINSVASFLPKFVHKHQQKQQTGLAQLNYEQVCAASTQTVNMRKHSLQLLPVSVVKTVRSSSLPDFRGLRQQHRMSFESTVCYLKYLVIEKKTDSRKRKNSSIVFKVWRTSMQLKRTKSYKKAAFLIMSSSLCFFFLNLPMIWFKFYNIIYPEQSQSLPSASGASQLLLAANPDNAKRLLHQSDADTASLDIIEICERLACYLYYLNFVSNMFFFTLKSPRRASNNSKDTSNLKLNNTTANQSKSNRQII